jgi:hypothetical protein
MQCCNGTRIFRLMKKPLEGKTPKVVDGANVLKMFLFRCKLCLNNIARCFMKFEAKWTTPVF